MSIERPIYQVTDHTINPATLLRFSDPGYQAPTDQDVKALKQKTGLSGSEIAQLVGVEPRTVRKWIAPPDASNSARIPYAAWRLLLVEQNLIK